VEFVDTETWSFEIWWIQQDWPFDVSNKKCVNEILIVLV